MYLVKTPLVEIMSVNGVHEGAFYFGKWRACGNLTNILETLARY